MNNSIQYRKLIIFASVIFCLTAFNGITFGQTLYDSFADGNFTANPVWGGTTATWQVVADSDASTGATGSNTVRLNATAVSATEYLSSQISTFQASQEWGVFFGRRNQALTSANVQYFWLFANEANLNSATVDGYRIAIGDNTGDDELRLEYIVDGAVSATVISSVTAIPNNLTDIGFLVRVTRNNAGVFTLYSSTLPTANGTGAIATDIPNTANTPVNQGTGTNNSLAPMANNYIGLAALHSTGASAIVAAEFDQIYLTTVPTTAAAGTISGRARTANGRGVKHAVIMLTGGGLEEPIYATTNQFGYYQFQDVGVGQSYILQISSGRYSFQNSSRVINLGDSLADEDFIADSPDVNSGRSTESKNATEGGKTSNRKF